MKGVKKRLILAGPTASGKSALAVAVAEATGAVIVNADSMQLYQELRLITARPSRAEEARAPHALYGHLSTAAAATAESWRAQVVTLLDGLDETPALLVGGTGLYMKALMEGFADMPQVPPTIREEVAALHAAEGALGFHARLAAVDPASAERLRPSDSQRVKRAYEVWAATGTPFSRFIDAPRSGPPEGYEFIPVVLAPDRAWLYDRINRRFEAMMAQGALEEVVQFATLLPDLPRDAPLRKALGVPELLAHLRGEIALPDAVTLAQAASRQYAKRQTTWFKHQLSQALTVNPQDYDQAMHQILSIMSKTSLTG
ncbi:tRNA (adenosine(37)-N6)-dimethylallyltransferase MiaA [Elstera cyanobacteriorum]|uniref:tRNA (adenosine(37)-N6)-dimethylallyltransferase MiaA n=1 Tax=Elstera cyanobacteriorum TaxID=2022747 RepID=UPI002356A0F9|nr:tRNA (adenosine(37)-N6)-dimethylallyltransferase MiaA [Elstera cyanobacteriorum]MCK6442958.1 tRNA (adenosine(37)-N6)-dimethylallyltransferase MiaA [Elstera cyanobacteriorum]